MTKPPLFAFTGKNYFPLQASTVVPLPPATYVLSTSISGMYLERVEDLKVPSRIYGKRHDGRILTSYRARAAEGRSTGVWLSGEKGSGKTMLSAVLSAALRADGLPTVLVQSPLHGPDFNKVVDQIGPACWIFDEFEKTYIRKSDDSDNTDPDPQDALLTVFSGGAQACNLYILTTNKAYCVNENMTNRPSRMLYYIEYGGVSDDVVREYVEHRMVDAARRQDMIKVLAGIPRCNFDIMQSAVEEHNRFGGEVEPLLAIMNIRRMGAVTWHFTYRGTRNKKKVVATATYSHDISLPEVIQDSNFYISGWKVDGVSIGIDGGGDSTLLLSFSNLVSHPDGSYSADATHRDGRGTVTFRPDLGAF